MRALGAIVLAAGASERFGVANKLLVSIDGNPLIRRVVLEIIGSGVAEVVVVTGWDSARISATLEDLTVRWVHNENWQSGIGTSIAAGVVALSIDIEGAFVVPGDMPLLDSSLLVRLASAFEEDGGRAVVFPVTASAISATLCFGRVGISGDSPSSRRGRERKGCCMLRASTALPFQSKARLALRT